MNDNVDPDARTAALPAIDHQGPVVLVNCFDVDPSRDEAFLALWERTSGYFRRQPGFVALRMHRALSDSAAYRYLNVAAWSSSAQYGAAHHTEEFRRVITDPAWAEFANYPNLYELIVEHSSGASGSGDSAAGGGA